MIYTVTFNPALDYVVNTEGLELGGINRCTSEQIFVGGKGINVSLVLRELGVPTKALGFVAGFTGNAIEQNLQSQGVETDFVHLPGGFSRINVKLRSAPGTETEINGQGPEIGAWAVEVLFQKLDTLSDGDTLVLAGSVPASVPQDMYVQILERVRDKKLRIVVDAAGDLLRKVLPYHPYLIKPNHHELAALFGKTDCNVTELHDLAQELQKMGARNVLVSMAGDGSLLLDEAGNSYCYPACKGVPVNSVGAGDSMVAGFLAGMENGDVIHALRLTTAAGGATVFGEGLAKRSEIDRLYESLS